MRKTYIVNPNQATYFQKILLEDSDIKPGAFVLPFSSAIYEESDKIHLENYQYLKSINLKHISLSPSLYFDLYAFRQELYEYNIAVQNLPETDSFNTEIKTLLNHMPLKTKKLPKSLSFVTTGLTHSQLSFLKKSNSSPLHFSEIKPTSIKYRRALNFRQEIEGAIQDILNKNIKSAYIAVPNLKNAWPYLKATYDRYNIPYVEQDPNTSALHQFNTFLNYLMDPCLPTALELIESNLLDLNHEKSLIQYIKHYNLNYNDLFKPFNYALYDDDLYDIQDLVQTQNDIQNDVDKVQDFLMKVNQQNLPDNLILGLQLVNEQSIINYIQNIFPLINYENLHFVQYSLNRLSSSPKIQSPIQPITYDSLPLKPIEHLYVLGLTSKNFPVLRKNNGILDEDYRKSIQNYPSLQKRNEYQIKELSVIFRKAINLNLSYHVSTYEGKPQIAAFEVQRFCNKHKIDVRAWKIIEADPFMDENYKLTPNVAHDLYMPNGKLNTSVSSLEKYMNDPYRFFIEDGLGIKKPFDFKLDARLIGTINHYAFEQYFRGNKSDLFALWDRYKPYLPLNTNYLPILINLNNKNTLENIHFLEEAIDHTDFKLFKTEQYIKDEIIFDDISLRGFVDRIDISNEHFIIIDYKSSPHSLSEKDVLNGLSLQLPTYAIAIAKKYGLSLFGIYYFAFNRKTTTPHPYKFLRSGLKHPESTSIHDYHDEFKLAGWTFNNPEEFGVSNQYFKGITGKGKVWGGAYIYENMENKIKEIIQDIKSNILNGILDKNEIIFTEDPDFDFKKEKDIDEFEV